MTGKQAFMAWLANSPVGRAPWEIRALRIAVGAILVLAAVSTLFSVIDRETPIITENKLEVGMMIGWIVAKSGTVIDWLFGGSESGTRRADHDAATKNAKEEEKPSGTETDPVAVKEVQATPEGGRSEGDVL